MVQFKMAAASCDSSSSEDEDREKFADIVKSIRLETTANGEGSSATGHHHHQEFGERSSKPSLRHWRRDEDQPSSTITPEFQKHVAKKLAAFLDSSVQMTDVRENNHAAPQESGKGIKLLSSAKQTLKSATDDNKKASEKKRPSQMCLSGSSDDEEEAHRLAEAAVSGYTILANGNEDGVRRFEDKTHTLTGDNDQSQHERKRKKFKEKNEDRKSKHEKKKKKKRHKET